MWSVFQIFCLIYAATNMEAARILAVFSVPGISHQAVFRPVMRELAKRGHEVVVITPDPEFEEGQSPENLTEIDVSAVSYNIMNTAITSGTIHDRLSYNKAKVIIEMIDNIFEAQVKSDQVQKLINDKNKKFDLLFIESCMRIAVSFHYLYNVPIIEFSSLGGSFKTFHGTGAPTNPLVYPSSLHFRINNLTFWEKISQLYTEYSINKAVEDSEILENQMAKKLFGQNVPDLSELRKNVQMLFLNVHPIWDFNRPVSPNIVYLGSLHLKPQKEIPKDLMNYLDRSQNGVIYISFGTNMRPSLLPPDKIEIFKNVFSQLPYDILWKWDSDDIPGRPKNVRVSKWFPQPDLLKHPKIKLFITQGGLQSTDEAIDAIVPLVIVPFRADQWFNAEQCVRLKIGKQVDIETITTEGLKSTIKAVIEDKSYRENVGKLRTLMRDQPQSPLERAVWWTEHVLKHGDATHLRAAAAYMEWTEYYALELIVVLITAIFIIIFGVLFVIYLFLIKKQKVKVKHS